MTARLRGACALATWMAFLSAALVAIHSVGGGLAPPSLSGGEQARAWLEQREPAEVAFALLRLAALALGWYLLVLTAVAAVARLLRLAAVVSVVDVVTVPAVRRLVEAGLGISLVATSVPAFPGAVSAEPPPVETMRRLPDEPAQPPVASTIPPVTMRRLPDEPPPPSPPPAPAPRASTSTAPPPARAPAPPGHAAVPPARAPTTSGPVTEAPANKAPATPAPSGSWAVRPGDHFWAVAEDVLARAWGRPPTGAELAPYWRSVVEANRARLRDPRNPDLLFPGQVLAVPPPPARPA